MKSVAHPAEEGAGNHRKTGTNSIIQKSFFALIDFLKISLLAWLIIAFVMTVLTLLLPWGLTYRFTGLILLLILAGFSVLGIFRAVRILMQPMPERTLKGGDWFKLPGYLFCIFFCVGVCSYEIMYFVENGFTVRRTARGSHALWKPYHILDRNLAEKLIPQEASDIQYEYHQDPEGIFIQFSCSADEGALKAFADRFGYTAFNFEKDFSKIKKIYDAKISFDGQEEPKKSESGFFYSISISNSGFSEGSKAPSERLEYVYDRKQKRLYGYLEVRFPEEEDATSVPSALDQ